MKVLFLQSNLTLDNPMDCDLQGSSVHGVLQERILEWCASPVDIPNPGIEPESPALQADSLLFELLGKPSNKDWDLNKIHDYRASFLPLGNNGVRSWRYGFQSWCRDHPEQCSLAHLDQHPFWCRPVPPDWFPCLQFPPHLIHPLRQRISKWEPQTSSISTT